MFDIFAQRTTGKTDDREVVDGILIEVVPTLETSKDMNAIDKKYSKQDRALNEIDLEFKDASKQIKRRIKEVKNSGYNRNSAETEKELYNSLSGMLKGRLDVVKEQNKITKEKIELQIKSQGKDGAALNAALGGGGEQQMAAKQLGMQMYMGNGSDIYNSNMARGIINPLNGSGDSVFGNKSIPMSSNPQTRGIELVSTVNEEQINYDGIERLMQPITEEIPTIQLGVESGGQIDYTRARNNIANRGSQNVKEVLHYVADKNVFWVETVDMITGQQVPGRDKHIAILKDGLSLDFRNGIAEDLAHDKYILMQDTVENMPAKYVDQWENYTENGIAGTPDDGGQSSDEEEGADNE